MPNEEPEKGDKVSWPWGGGAPTGKVVETKAEGEIAIKSKRGNTIKKNASPSNPAVHVGREGNDVVKRASELNVEEKASASGAKKSKSPAPPAVKENGDKKRDHDEVDKDEAADDQEPAAVEEKKEVKKAPAAKKQKKEPASKKKEKEKAEKPAEEKKQANGDEAKKGRGRPKGTAAAAGGARKKKDAKPRATEGIGSRTRSRA